MSATRKVRVYLGVTQATVNALDKAAKAANLDRNTYIVQRLFDLGQLPPPVWVPTNTKQPFTEIAIYIRPVSLEQVKSAAADHGLPMSSYIRMRVLGLPAPPTIDPPLAENEMP